MNNALLGLFNPPEVKLPEPKPKPVVQLPREKPEFKRGTFEATTGRKEAKDNHYPHFLSKFPCKRCGSHERYTANGRCVPCEHTRNREDTDAKHAAAGTARTRFREADYAAAKVEGRPTYEAVMPCRKCGTHARYTSSRSCVMCHRGYAKAHACIVRAKTPPKKKLQVDYFVDRDYALEAGLTYYTGEPCRACGCRVRSARTNKCKACMARFNRRKNEKCQSGLHVDPEPFPRRCCETTE